MELTNITDPANDNKMNTLVKGLNVVGQFELFATLHACKTQGIPSSDPWQFLWTLEEYTDEDGKMRERFIPAS